MRRVVARATLSGGMSGPAYDALAEASVALTAERPVVAPLARERMLHALRERLRAFL